MRAEWRWEETEEDIRAVINCLGREEKALSRPLNEL
jgi:hypothetical protein